MSLAHTGIGRRAHERATASNIPAGRIGVQHTSPADTCPPLLPHHRDRLRTCPGRAAQRRAEAEALPVESRVADAGDLPFADASFDLVLSAIGVMFTADHQPAACELVRVCEPRDRRHRPHRLESTSPPLPPTPEDAPAARTREGMQKAASRRSR
nr:methyltransferase domain-containing protein [Haloechinothrix aidingensis]